MWSRFGTLLIAIALTPHNCDTSVRILLYWNHHTTYTIPWLLHHLHLRTMAAEKDVPFTSTVFLLTRRKSNLITGCPSPRASNSLFSVPCPLINFSWSFSCGMPQWLWRPSNMGFSKTWPQYLKARGEARRRCMSLLYVQHRFVSWGEVIDSLSTWSNLYAHKLWTNGYIILKFFHHLFLGILSVQILCLFHLFFSEKNMKIL